MNPQCQALSVSNASVRPLPASPTASTGAGLPSAPLADGCTSSVAAPGFTRGTRLIPASGGSLAHPASFSRGFSTSDVIGCVCPSGVRRGLKLSVVNAGSFSPSSVGATGGSSTGKMSRSGVRP